MAENDSRLLMANAGGNHCLAHLRSVMGKGAGAWIQTVPTNDDIAFSACEFLIATSLPLGPPLPSHNWVQHCNCGAELDKFGFHLITYKRGGGPIWSMILLLLHGLI